MAPYTKPETVLRRSDELLSVNQPMSALSSISEIFSSKRFRQTPLSSLEPIMLRFIDLCVLLRKGRTAKEGLHMYKNVAQNTSVGSVEVVIQHFIKKSKEKLDEALAKVEEIEGPAAKEAALADGNAEEGKDAPKEKTASADVEDLEASETPEGLLLSTVSEEKSRDRTYRELVTPWLRGLWEAYRTALDILRNNARLETVYQQIATEAFNFCLTHDRKTEFRRLSETLRSNLTSSQKYTNQTHSINLNDPEVLQRHLDTRFQQLNTAVELELWQEAFRTAEDIHGLVAMSKKPPKASVMASFYEKMTKVFGVGHNFLFHAAAYGKYYALQATTVTDEAQAEKLASAVLVSALAVPVGGGITGEGPRRREGDEGEAKGKLGRLAALLGLATAPSRAGLLRDALTRGTLKRASADVRALYEILEVDFHPLSITSKIEPILTRLAADPDAARYVDPLKDVVLARLFQQLAQVYDSLKLARVVKLASFGQGEENDEAATRARVEKFVMEACRRGELDITLDHATASIRFADKMFETESSSPAASSSQTADSMSVLQPSSSTLLRTHLTRLATTLANSLDCISPSISPLAHALIAQTSALAALSTEVPKQRKALLKRKVTIEERKRRAEEAMHKKEKEEQHARAVRMAQVAEEQQARIQLQARERAAKIQEDQAAKIRAEESRKVATAMAAQAGLKIDADNLGNVDTNTIIQMGVEQIEKDKKELAAKLKIVNKRLDHSERALRREEIPLLQQDYVEQQARDKATHITAQADHIASLRAQHEQDAAIKGRLARLMPDYQAYRVTVAQRRGLDFAAAEAESRKKITDAKAQRKAEVLEDRAKERARKAAAAKRAKEEEEEERIRQEEEEKEEEVRKAKQAEIEEQERKFREEAEAKKAAQKAEREKERASADEAARKQRLREEEAEARRAERKNVGSGTASPARTPALGSQTWSRPSSNGAATPPTSSAPPAGRPVVAALAPKAGGWRDRVNTDGGSAPGSRAQSPGAQDAPPPRFVGGASASGPSWRDKQAAKAAGGPNGSPKPEDQNDAIKKPTSAAGGDTNLRALVARLPVDNETPLELLGVGEGAYVDEVGNLRGHA